MPITKQAIKRMKQSEVAKNRNKHYGSRMKSMVKYILNCVQEGELDKAKTALSEAIKAIDMAAKKKIIHKNNAARKKSRIQKVVNTGVSKKVEVKANKGKKVLKSKKTVAKAESKEKQVIPKVEKKKEVMEKKTEMKPEEKAE